MKDSHILPANLVDQLIAARKRSRLSQDELASLASISRRPIYDIEHGNPGVKIGTLIKILDALGLELTFKPRGPQS
jgi:transcriptional regulator with XRE-family HTH domain